MRAGGWMRIVSLHAWVLGGGDDVVSFVDGDEHVLFLVDLLCTHLLLHLPFVPLLSFYLLMLVDAFPACGMGVSVATDGTLYETEVYAASHSPAALAALQHLNASTSAHGHGSSHGHSSHGHPSHGHGGKEARDGKGGKPETRAWGDRPVLVLLGIRLGLDGVNPVYYETIKVRAVVLVSFLEARGEEEWAVTWRVRLY
ncbi:hypothetical protein B0H11DRAFT_2251214 [Mycena galericulata]|nr:hypothetical protein B0H11DRAFT_2251214 [Mycena galericulata]